MTREPFIAHSELTNEIYIVVGKEKYRVTEQAIKAVMAIKALEQESNTWNLDDAREDFMSDVYNTLELEPTNNEANRIIDSFDRVTSGIKQEPILDKVRAEIKAMSGDIETIADVLAILDKYKVKSEKT